jgi:hypothetical protein
MIRRIFAAIAVFGLALPLYLVPSSSASAVHCTPPSPSSPTYYGFVHTYRDECATNQNYDRTFPDVTVSRLVDGRNRLSVTTSAAIGGAVASLKVNDKEFIASGGYGSAFQYAFHAWNEGGAASECYNPTQGGASIDTKDSEAPYHSNPSTTALYTMEQATAGAIRTAARPAMFMTRADPNPGYGGCFARDHQPDASPFNQGLSPYWLDADVQLDHGIPGLDNVIRMSSVLTSDDADKDHLNGVLVAYLQRDFSKVFSYDRATHRLRTEPNPTVASADPIARCTVQGDYCLGIYIRPSVRASGAYYYSMTRPPLPYNGMLGEDILQVDFPANDVRRGERLQYELYVAVGNRDRVADSIRALSIAHQDS